MLVDCVGYLNNNDKIMKHKKMAVKFLSDNTRKIYY